MKRVLIIEDDRFNRRLYRDLLEAEGLEVELAASAREGLEAASAAPPGLIVMDIEMPGMDGLVATRTLKRHAATAAVPVLVISAHAQDEQEGRAREAGCDAFLRKPLRFPEFQQTVRRLLES